MRKLIAAVALALGLASALPAQQQQWGEWVAGLGSFGNWHWASPVASAAALDLITGTPGLCMAVMDAGQVYCWSGDTDEWVSQGGGTDTDDQTAAEVPYDPTASGLTATDVQAAVDELAAAPTGDVTGPSSSTVHGFALFADTTGKLLTSSTWTLDADVLLAPNVGAIKIGSSGLRLRNGEIDRISGPLDIHTNGADALNIYAGGDLAIGGALENIYLGGGPAQPVIGTGLFDFTASKLRLPNGNTAALPATCSLGQQYVNTQTALHCDCTATNTWTCGKAATAATLEANGTNCGAGNYPLGVDASGNAEGCTAASGGGTPGGSNTQVQFNDSGAFGGDAGLTYNKTTDALTLAGLLNGMVVGSVDGTILGIKYSGGSAYYGLSNDLTTARLRADALEFSNIGNSRWARFEANLMMFGQSTAHKWYNHNDPQQGSADTIHERQAAAVHKFSDAIRLNPRSSPPVTCGAASSEGAVYTDTSHALCYCDGTAWVVLTGAGSCA